MKRFLLFLLALSGLMALSIPALADDVAIYGTQAVTLKPNVMIIFDNSGSMDTADVPKPEYDPDFDYTGRFIRRAVYYKSRRRWNTLTRNVDNIRYTAAKDALKVDGYITAQIDTNTLAYGGNRRTFYTGNFKNYDEMGSSTKATRLFIAKQVVTSLLEETPDVLFGLMVFNRNDGGKLMEECGSTLTKNADGTETINNANIIDTINDLTASTNTPLAETLAEAGLYFAGKQTYFNCTTEYDYWGRLFQ